MFLFMGFVLVGLFVCISGLFLHMGFVLVGLFCCYSFVLDLPLFSLLENFPLKKQRCAKKVETIKQLAWSAILYVVVHWA